MIKLLSKKPKKTNKQTERKFTWIWTELLSSLRATNCRILERKEVLEASEKSKKSSQSSLKIPFLSIAEEKRITDLCFIVTFFFQISKILVHAFWEILKTGNLIGFWIFAGWLVCLCLSCVRLEEGRYEALRYQIRCCPVGLYSDTKQWAIYGPNVFKFYMDQTFLWGSVWIWSVYGPELKTTGPWMLWMRPIFSEPRKAKFLLLCERRVLLKEESMFIFF